jgi:hypothetical protein
LEGAVFFADEVEARVEVVEEAVGCEGSFVGTVEEWGRRLKPIRGRV